MNSIEAVVAGHICLDFIPALDHVPEGKLSSLLQPGHLLITGPATFSTGGPVSNTGLALHRLGISTRLMAKIGADPLGKIVRGIVEAYGPELVDGLVEDPNSATSYSIIVSAPGVDRIFLHCPGANDTFDVEDVDFELLRKVRLMHFGYPPVMKRMYSDDGRELVRLFRRAKESGVTTSLDMTYPDPDAEGGKVDWRTILANVLPFVDVFLPSFDELFFMLHREQFMQFRAESINGDLQEKITPERLHTLGNELLKLGVKVAVIKLGDRGLYLRTASKSEIEKIGQGRPSHQANWGDREMWQTCFKVNVVGTTGSGDATIAGFLSAMLRGLNPEEAVVAAVAVGACNVEAADALSGLRGWDETHARIRAGWEQLPLQLSDPTWRETRPGLWERVNRSG
jgi:sugar/nucleoside kinase (ribokinase family)